MKIMAPAAALAVWRRIAIANKLTVLLTLVAMMGLVAGGLALSLTITPAFDRLEHETVQRRINLADQFLQAALSGVEGTASDYAVWDESFNYIHNENTAFVQESLTGLVNVGVNGTAYVRFNGDLLHAHYIDLETGEPIADRLPLLQQLATDPVIIQQAQTHPRVSYFARIDGNLVAVGVARIVKSDGSGEPAGFVLMLREVSNEEATELLQTPVTIGAAPTEENELAVREDSVWRVIVPVRDVGGRQVAALRFEVPREISQLGLSSLLAAFAASSAIIMAMLLVVGVGLTRIVGRRLATIERHMQTVADTGDLAPLNADPNADELGSLGVSFNKMTAQLKDLREQLEIQSYKLGRGEWAAGVMHNVRNALNPVTVIMSKVAGQKSAARMEDLVRAARELASDDCPPARRQALSAFMVAAFEENDRSASARRTDLISARSLLSEAIRILSDQHKIAHEEIPSEAVDLLELVEHNIALVRFVPWGEVSVELPSHSAIVHANKLLLSQVVGNLLTNAVEAIVAAERRPGKVKVAIRTFTDEGGEKVELTIADDGAGFASERADKLFVRGESSKKSGSGGLGLHWCANTVTAMSGKLALSSDGQGHGARATLVLPGHAAAAHASDIAA